MEDSPKRSWNVMKTFIATSILSLAILFGLYHYITNCDETFYTARENNFSKCLIK